MQNGDLKVEVAYAEPDRQWLIDLKLAAGSRVEDALAAAAERLPDQALGDGLALGIFGAPCRPDQVLADGDRVEIYRPLINDAKHARRERAQEQNFSQGLKRD